MKFTDDRTEAHRDSQWETLNLTFKALFLFPFKLLLFVFSYVLKIALAIAHHWRVLPAQLRSNYVDSLL